MALIKPLVLDAGIIRQMQTADTYANLSFLKPVRAAELTNVALATAVENGDSFGGVTLATGDRVALFGQTDPKENGVYVVAASGTPARAEDAAAGSSLLGAMIVVAEGTLVGRVVICDGTVPATVGTSNLTFSGPLARINKAQVWTVFQRFFSVGLTDQSGAGSRGLFLNASENLTADRTLNLVVGDANRTLTLTGDATVQGDQTGVNGENVLGSNFTLNATTGTYQDTGVAVTLPSAGTYLLFLTARALVGYTAGTFGYVYAKLYNSTAAADVSGSNFTAVISYVINTTLDQTKSIPVLATVTGADTIKLYASRNFDGTLATSLIATDITKITYIKLK